MECSDYEPIHKHISSKQMKKILDFISGDDLDFYVEFIVCLPDEQQEKFSEENPDFMSEFPVSRDRMYLLRDKNFREILRKIKRYEEEARDGFN